MGNQIEQYRPTYFEGFENETVSFDTVDELKRIPFVAGFSEMDEFCGFALSEHHLMAVYQDGHKWWVVGIIQNPNAVDLPAWERDVNPSNIQKH